jgi:GxxExxY protein
MTAFLKRQDILYPELSYLIVGCAFDVFNSIGPGHIERYYQNAMRIAFQDKSLNFKEQVYCPLRFKGQFVGKGFLDYLVEDKIVVEIKKGENFSLTNIEQVVQYLKNNNLQLGLLINFGFQKVHIKRIVNLYPFSSP